MYQPGIIITIDTEKDMCSSSGQWITPEKQSFNNITHGLPATLIPLFSQLGVHSTWLVSAEVMRSRESVAILRSIPNAEFGAHLHGEQVAPSHEYDSSSTGSGTIMQCLYPIDIEAQKLKTLTELFIESFDTAPVSFRAGRYAVSNYTAKFLKTLGYRVDSSVVPHTRHAYPAPHCGTVDFTDLPEVPYPVGKAGNIWEPGQSSFWEIPITSMPRETGMGTQMNPVWFRPGITTTADLKKIIDHVAAQNRQGVCRPLVMMFHSMEIMPAMSPYIQTQADVERFIASLEETVAYALEQGFVSRTLQEEHAVLNKKANSIGLPFSQEHVDEVIDSCGAEPWFKWRYSTLGDQGQYISWIYKNIPEDAYILSTGCGAGFTPIILEKSGYKNIYAADIDEKSISAAKMLSTEKSNIHFMVDDSLHPSENLLVKFDVVEAIGFLMLIEGLSYADFFNCYNARMNKDGVLIIDVIDKAYDSIPGNDINSADRAKPADQQRPSEYKTRLSTAEVRQLARQSGFLVINMIDLQIPGLPRKIYFLKKTHEIHPQ